jgi:hypothetical protein
MVACHCNPFDARNRFQSQHPQVVTSGSSKILSEEDVDLPPFWHWWGYYNYMEIHPLLLVD